MTHPVTLATFWLLPSLCLVSLAAGWLWPVTLPETRVRLTAGVALVWATLAAVLLPRAADPDMGPKVRAAWTLAWLAYLVHVGSAFHFAHGWSHAEAVAHVERRSGFGPGVWFSHLFTLLWTANVAWWWFAPGSREARPAWVAWLLFGYMGFITFNATVIYGTATRFPGALLFLGVAASAWMEWRWPSVSRGPAA